MPEEGISFLPKNEILSKEQIIRLCRIFSSQGVNKIRITGGEPFVRPDMMEILKQIRPLFKSVNITTNATLISKYVNDLVDLNIGTINISLDSLNPLTFFAITKRSMFEEVWDTIMKFYEAGVRVKLNAVLMRGINDHEISNFLDVAKEYNIDVRFIEAMPFNGYDENNGLLIDYMEMLERIEALYPDVVKNISVPTKSASIRYDVPGFKGSLGLIPAYSRTLCGSCNRLRVTAKGTLMNCLYSNTGLNLKTLLEEAHSDEKLVNAINSHILKKPVNGHVAEANRGEDHDFQSMTTIGG
jgi:cyclic pyranopterin phosphate synthase